MQKNTTVKHTECSGFAALLLFAVAATVILANPSASSQGALEGLKLCSAVVIPALFPFTAVALFFEKSGALSWIGQRLNRPAYFLFGTGGAGLSALVLSLLGGYPVGAKILDALCQANTLTEAEAKKLLRFCINPSPAFFIAVVGSNLLGSKSAGIILMLSNLIACFLLTALAGKKNAKKRSETDRCNRYPAPSQKRLALSDAFVESVAEAAGVIVGICAWVTLFSSVSALLKTVISDPVISAAISPLLEITFGCIEVSKIGLTPCLYSLLLAFGGLSTICQVKQSARHLNPSFSFLICHRMLHGVVASLISAVLFRLFPPASPVLSNAVEVQFIGFPMVLPSIALLAMAIVFLVYLRPTEAATKH